jgi:Flp pilus assembly protein TadG
MESKSQGGNAAIEFALILPFLVLFLFGTLEFSLAFYNQQMITNASREGARAGIVARSPRLSDTDILNVVATYCQNHLVTFGAPNSPVVQISPAGNRDGMSFGQDLTVTVTFNYGFLFLTNVGFGPIDLTASTVMKME